MNSLLFHGVIQTHLSTSSRVAAQIIAPKTIRVIVSGKPLCINDPMRSVPHPTPTATPRSNSIRDVLRDVDVLLPLYPSCGPAVVESVI